VEEQRPPIGAVLASKYRVDSVLGAGGMGVVLAATHLQLREQVAIKLLRTDAAMRPVAVERFLREAQVAMKLRGEHVVRVFDVGTLENGAPFIAMECLQGSDLSAVVRAEGRLPLATAVDYVLQACEAIAEAHALGVIHRDLKPANLFLTSRVDGSPSIKVLDFGVSKIGGELAASRDSLETTADDPDADVPARPAPLEPPFDSKHGVTGTRAVLGSPRYMAPEQLRSPRDVDVRADVWALGCILFELAAGKPPFAGETVQEIQAAVDALPVPALPDAPPGLARALQSCLTKDPAHRCPNVAQLVEALAPFASAEGAASVKRVRGMTRAHHPPAASAAAAPPIARTHDAVAGDVARPIRRTSVGALLAVLALVVAASAVLLRARGDTRPVTSATGVSEVPTPPVRAAPSSAPSGEVATPVASPAPDTFAASTMGSAAAPVASKRAVHGGPREAATSRPAPVTSDAPSVATPQPPSQEPDPLKLDAGFLFLERK
jgi:serine/threonine-protein kinase